MLLCSLLNWYSKNYYFCENYKFNIMAILVIDSKDSSLLNIILELVKKFKGVKAKYIDTDDSIEELDDKAFLNEMLEASKSGQLSNDDAVAFLNELETATR